MTGVDIERDLSHPYDRGYWARYDERPRPKDKEEAEGWDTCDDECRLERQGISLKPNKRVDSPPQPA
jgi:hypothetical protein